MASHLLTAGHRLTVSSRTMSKCDELVRQGACAVSTPRKVAEASQVVFTMVGSPADVEEVILGPETGVLAGLREKNGAVLVDMTTSSPELARRVHAECAATGVDAIDAPVSGGDKGAQAGALSIMVGGDEAALERVRPLLDLMGTPRHMGGPGSGQHTKMCNQILACSNMIGVCESLAYAEQCELQPSAVIESIGSGAAGSWLLNNLGSKVVDRDYEPGFMIEHFVKDLGIALSEARAMGLELPGTALARMLYFRLARDRRMGRLGTQALIEALRHVRCTTTDSELRIRVEMEDEADGLRATP